MTKLSVLLCVAAVFCAGCQTVPDGVFRLPESALETRALQTRQYDEASELEILSASAGVLQDLGFAIDEIERPLGLLTASKHASAEVAGEAAVRAAGNLVACVYTLGLVCRKGASKYAKDKQDIRLALVVTPVQDAADEHSVRITIQRIVWDRDQRVVERETIEDPEVYVAFFDKLSKSVALEKEGL